MAQETRQPRNIFEQILFAQEVTNDNVVALADNMAVMNTKIDVLMAALGLSTSEPTALGTDTKEEGEQK